MSRFMVAGVASMLVVAVVAGACAGRLVAPAKLSGPAPLRVAQAVPPAHAERLGAVLARLDRARVEGRAALKRARTPTAQASRARRLRDAHRAAAASVRQLADEDRTPLSYGLLSTGRTYVALAEAASEGSRAGFAAAAREVRAVETMLAFAAGQALAVRAPRDALVEPAAPSATWAAVKRFLLVLLALLGGGAAGVAVGLYANQLAATAGRIAAGLARRVKATARPRVG